MEASRWGAAGAGAGSGAVTAGRSAADRAAVAGIAAVSGLLVRKRRSAPAASDPVPQTEQRGIYIRLELVRGELAGRRDQQDLELCDELWLCGDRISEGMANEKALAEQIGIPVRQISAEDIQEVDFAATKGMGMSLG